MASGLVPVVSDLPSGIRELVDESTGIRVDPDNTRGYAEAIIRLHSDREAMRKLAQNAREKVRLQFSVGAMTDRWLAALPPPPATVSWPEAFTPKPILESPQPWRFWPVFRLVRRSLIRFKPLRQ
jgi:hypothetical protein